MKRAPALVILVTAIGAAAAMDLPRPALELERTPNGMTRVYARAALADGSVARALLRETTATVETAAAGRDPRGAAAFVTWRESGSAEGWFAFSRDAGRTWTDGRSLPAELRLRDGATRSGAALPAPRAGYELPAGGRVFLVQFHTQSLPEWRDALTAAGAEVLAYFPNNAHIVRLAPSSVAAVARLDFVERVEPFHPWYRLDAGVRAFLDGAGGSGEARGVNVVALEWGAAALRRIADAAARLGAGPGEVPDAGQILQLTLTREQVRAVAALDDVAWIDLQAPPEPDMDLVREDSGANFVETSFGYCGQGVRGEVLDGGIQQNHQDFDGILMHTAADVQDHGTSTYGIVFGNGARDGDGSAKATGHLPCAQGIFGDYDNMGNRFTHTQQLKSAPYFASFQSCSFGNGLTRSYTSYSFDVDDIAWRLDFAIVQSQSNEGNQDSRPQAWGKNVISVGGINHYNSLGTGDDCWCNGASIGPAEDGRIKPDLAYWYDWIYTTTIGNGYTSTFAGTSAATPETAGAIGLIVQMWADNVFNTNPQGSTVFEKQPRLATIKALAINTANQYPFTASGQDLSRMKQGWGRPSVRNAKERAARSFVVDEADALTLGQTASYPLTVEQGETALRATLVYTDPPGTTSATLHRINDLDLKLTSPSGVVYWGNNGLNAGNWSTPGGSRNTKDTVENVFVQNPEAGLWTVAVNAFEINQDQNRATPQTDAVFGLVVTGAASDCAGPTVNFTITPSPARVGQPVLFDSTVSGGAGGPYVYEWFLDADDTVDATTADVTYVYHRPFSGEVRLRVTDAAACAARSRRSHTVTGPDLRYDAYVDLVQVQGNGNGAVDPGETWDLRIRVKNSGNETATGVTLGLAVAPGNPGPVTLLTATDGAAGNILVGATGTTAEYFRFQVGGAFPCGSDALFSVVRLKTTDPANQYPDEVGAVRVLVGGAGAPASFYADGFETNAGWSLDAAGEWQIGKPLGKGSAPPDPLAAAAGTQVLGNDLAGTGLSLGDYEPLVADSTAVSPALDCRGKAKVSLQFSRWLNVASADVARIDVSNDGTNWVNVYSVSTGASATSWSTQSYDISAVADNRATVRVRFGLVTDLLNSRSGWNVDNLQLFGTARTSCEPFGTAPAPGASSGLTVQRSGTQLALAWAPDCAGAASYGVYRGNLLAGYGSLAPEPGQCTVAGTGATIPQGPGTGDFFLVVPNTGGFEGSYGATSDGGDRPPAAAPCYPRDRIDACAP